MTGQQSHVYRRAGAVDFVQIFDRIRLVDAAVAAEHRRHAHAQHTVQYIELYPPIHVHGILMHVNVDEARCDNSVLRINHEIRFRLSAAHPGNPSILHQQIQPSIHPIGRIDQPSAAYQRFHLCSLQTLPLYASSTLFSTRRL